MSNDCLYDLARIRIYRRCDGYYLRWYYNGWHYWFFYPGSITFATEGENYWTLGTQKMTIGTGQITEEQCNAIRTIQNTKEIYIYTDSGWGVVRAEHNSLVVYDHKLHGYEIEITIVIGSRAISTDGFSPAISLPSKPPDAPWDCELSIVIAGQTWMCANWDADYPGSKVYNNDETNRDKFGGLYSYSQVMAAGFVPAGWHVPTEAEWTTLITALGGLAAAGGELKAIGTTYWNAPNTGAVDSVDFDARGGGYYWAGAFANIFQTGYYLTADHGGSGFGWYFRYVRFDYNSGAVQILSGNFTQPKMSLRLIKDAYVETPHAMLLTTTGTGAGLNQLIPQVTRDIELTLDGTAHFYSDMAGTIDLGQSYTVSVGTVTPVYIKCPSGTANLTFSDAPSVFYLNFSGYTNAPEISGSISEFDHIEELAFSSVHVDITHTTAELPATLESLSLQGSGVSGFVLSGDVANLPAIMYYLGVSVTNALTGDVADLPVGLTTISVYDGNSLSGDLADLPVGLTYLNIQGNNTIIGDVADIAGNLTTLYLTGNNVINGDVADLPATLTYLYVTGTNGLTGDVADLPAALATMYVLGLNSISGDLADLPATLTYLHIHGANTITGDIADLPAAMTYCVLMGSNTVSGDIADVSNNLKYFLFYGLCQVDTYTGKAWGVNMQVVGNEPSPGFGLDAAEMDQLLIDLSGTTWTGLKVIQAAGNNAAPTAASAAAVAILVGMGVTVTTN